jgi:hypothetical protein
MRLGKTWTGLVAVQVALSMAVLPAVGEILWETFKSTLIGPGFESGEFLTARVAMEGESSGTEQADTGRFGNLQGELVRELEENGGRTRGALSQFQPGFGAQRNMESDTSAEARRALIRTAFDRVDEGYFEVFGQSLLAGRGFEAGDFQTGRTSVIVNRTFVDRSRNALGRRFRTPATAEGGAPGPWYEIVGVVEDLAPNETQATMYHPMVPGQVHPVNLTLHVGDPMPDEIGGRIREVTIALDPSLRVGAFRPLDEVFGELYFVRNMIASSILAGLAIVLLFTLAGVNTLMAFTVAQSRREIGIRSALGAERWRLLTDIFRKGLIPVVAGAAIGWLIAFGIDIYLSGDGGSVYALSGAAAFMLVLGVLSLAGPARKITKVEPTAVLKDS